jgi:translation initiation factor 4E
MLAGLSSHPVSCRWVFWFRQQHAPGAKVVDYEEGIKRISNFSSVRNSNLAFDSNSSYCHKIESFWTLWAHLNPPSLLQPTTDYLLFHSAVRRPVWEDPLNIGGGKWIIRLRKGVADRLWEDLVLAVIGDQFDDGESDESGQPEICGCTISVRQSEDIISLWNKTGHDPKIANHTRSVISLLRMKLAGTYVQGRVEKSFESSGCYCNRI